MLYFVLWGSGRNAGSKTQRGAYTSSILFYSACTSQRHKLVSAELFSMFSAKNVWRVYVFTWREDVKNYAKLDLTVQTKSDFQKCDLNRKFKPQTNVARNGFALGLSKNIWIFVEFKIKIHIGTQNATFELYASVRQRGTWDAMTRCFFFSLNALDAALHVHNIAENENINQCGEDVFYLKTETTERIFIAFSISVALASNTREPKDMSNSCK